MGCEFYKIDRTRDFFMQIDQCTLEHFGIEYIWDRITYSAYHSICLFYNKGNHNMHQKVKWQCCKSCLNFMHLAMVDMYSQGRAKVWIAVKIALLTPVRTPSNSSKLKFHSFPCFMNADEPWPLPIEEPKAGRLHSTS